MISTIILAAGKGTRMNKEIPKVLIPFRNKPMIRYVLENSKAITSGKIVIVVGYQKNMVIEETKDFYPVYVTQEQQCGTGHAVMCTEKVFKDHDEDILILMGDCPLLTQSVLEEFIEFHQIGKYNASLISKDSIDPGGCGRIIRYQDGTFKGCIEKKDLVPEQTNIKEINVGAIICNSKKLFENLHKTTNNNSQGEYYLTDIFNVLDNIGVYKTKQLPEYFTFNTPEELWFGSLYFRCIDEYDFEDFKEMYPTITKDKFDIFVKHKKDSVYVVTDNEKVIATITLITDMKLFHNNQNALHVEDLMVHPEYRKRGVGSYLMLQAKVYAQNHNCYKIILNCNESVRGFYERSGFYSKNIEMSLY